MPKVTQTPAPQPQHAFIGLAQLRLRNRFSLEELEQATTELTDKGYIADCTEHEDCVVIRAEVPA